jgi:hypothetical protein
LSDPVEANVPAVTPDADGTEWFPSAWMAS